MSGMSRYFKTLSTGPDWGVAAFVARAVGVIDESESDAGSSEYFGRYNTLGFWDSRGLKVGLVYNQFRHPNIGIHVASRPGSLWCYPDILWHIFSYPFSHLQCTRVTAPIIAGNSRSIRTVESLGFVLEGTLRKADRKGRDVLIYGMLREECRWIADEKRMAA